MGIRLDIVFSAIIVGILTMLIFGVNSFILQNSVDTRLYNDMQLFSDVSTDVFQEELRTAVEIIHPSSATSPTNFLEYVDFSGDTVEVARDGRVIELVRSSAPNDTIRYDLYLSSIQFDLEPDTVAVPHYLRVTFQTTSDPSQHASFRNEIQTANAFSERSYYLRNVHLIAEGGGSGSGSGGGNESGEDVGGSNDGDEGSDDSGSNNDSGGGSDEQEELDCRGPKWDRPPGC